MPKVYDINWRLTIPDEHEEEFGGAIVMAALNVFNRYGLADTYSPIHIELADDTGGLDA